MAERIDHAAEAVRLLEAAARIPSNEDETNPAAHLAILEAQTHATLALVEQKRLDNLVRLSMDSDWEARQALHARGEGAPLRPWVKDVLGIGESDV